MNSNRGILYVIATPIGNLADISDRARSVLAAVDLVLAEDTRHSGKLLQHCGITTPMRSLHEHNEDRSVADSIEQLQGGDSLGLISDAGTPLISDPGYRLIRAALVAGIRVVPVPGPSALIAGLSVAGQPTDRFVFEGYLPARATARRKRMQELAAEQRTLVFYEAPHRLDDWLVDAIDCFGADRPATLAKELTKLHEQIVYATLPEIRTWLAVDPKRGQGEFVLILAGHPDPPAGQELEPLLRILLAHLPVKSVATVAAELSGRGRNECYRLALSLQGKQQP